MTATDPEAVADSAEAREPRDGGQNVREDPRSVWRRIDRADAARTLFTGLCAAVTAFASAWPDRRWPAVAVVGLAVGCWPIAAEAWEDLRHRKMSMELSMLIAVVAAGAIGEWVTSLVIAAFVLAAEILEDLSKDRGRDALTDLMAFLPETVRVRREGGTQSLPLAEVRPGEVVVVAPGGRVPVDGTVAAGRSSVDQSRITGEPLPVDVSAGETVYAGSINRVGALEIRAERVGSDSSYGRIVEAIRRTQSSQAPVQRLADRFAAYLVYLALAGAAVTFAVTRDWTSTISVVVVAGACGIAAGTPLAVLAAIARVARSGAFVKDGAHLEALSQAGAIVFDKTGTLTAGAPVVSKVLPAPGTSPEDLLAVLAAAESYSEHPLGEAVVEHARSLGLPVAAPEAFEYEPGLGIRARVGGRAVAAGGSALVPDAPEAAEESREGVVTPIHVDVDGAYAGTVLLADAVRGSPGGRRSAGDGAGGLDGHRRPRADGAGRRRAAGDRPGPRRASARREDDGRRRAAIAGAAGRHDRRRRQRRPGPGPRGRRDRHGQRNRRGTRQRRRRPHQLEPRRSRGHRGRGPARTPHRRLQLRRHGRRGPARHNAGWDRPAHTDPGRPCARGQRDGVHFELGAADPRQGPACVRHLSTDTRRDVSFLGAPGVREAPRGCEFHFSGIAALRAQSPGAAPRG